MTDATIIVRVENELKAAFTEAAKAADRTTSLLIRDFMRDYVRQQTADRTYTNWLRQKAEAGRAAVRDGNVKSDVEVEAHFATRRAASLREADKAGR